MELHVSKEHHLFIEVVNTTFVFSEIAWIFFYFFVYENLVELL